MGYSKTDIESVTRSKAQRKSMSARDSICKTMKSLKSCPWFRSYLAVYLFIPELYQWEK